MARGRDAAHLRLWQRMSDLPEKEKEQLLNDDWNRVPWYTEETVVHRKIPQKLLRLDIRRKMASWPGSIETRKEELRKTDHAIYEYLNKGGGLSMIGSDGVKDRLMEDDCSDYLGVDEVDYDYDLVMITILKTSFALGFS